MLSSVNGAGAKHEVAISIIVCNAMMNVWAKTMAAPSTYLVQEKR